MPLSAKISHEKGSRTKKGLFNVLYRYKRWKDCRHSTECWLWCIVMIYCTNLGEERRKMSIKILFSPFFFCLFPHFSCGPFVLTSFSLLSACSLEKGEGGESFLMFFSSSSSSSKATHFQKPTSFFLSFFFFQQQKMAV